MSSDEYRKLSPAEIRERMKDLKIWKIVGGKLHRELKFRSFEDAIGFIERASFEISKLDHHPEWFNVYNQVRIDLVTHDVGGISDYDFILAKALDKIASTFKAK